MEFNPSNPIVKLCLQGMAMEEKGKPEEAIKSFLQAWHEAKENFEKFLAAYYVTRHQKNTSDKLRWLETTLELALKINDNSVNSALPALYLDISECYKYVYMISGDKSQANWRFTLRKSG